MKLATIIIIFFFFLTPIPSKAQQDTVPGYKYNLSIISDNDSYLLMGSDGYYTDGIYFNLNFIGKSVRKKIHTIEIGQLMYNAHSGDYELASEIDRPVTALLYAKYSQTIFSKNESVFEWNILGGVLGPSAQGESLQKFIHKSIGAYQPTEWPFQLNQSIGANTGLKWSPNIFSKFETNIIACKPIIKANAGSFFDNTNIGLLFQLGNFEKNSQSVLWQSRINRNNYLAKHPSESFFYFYPQFFYQLYNATVQGGLFIKNKGPVTGVLNRYVFRQQFGWQYAKKRFSFSPSIIFDGRQAKEQQTPQWYGEIKIGYKFGK